MLLCLFSMPYFYVMVLLRASHVTAFNKKYVCLKVLIKIAYDTHISSFIKKLIQKIKDMFERVYL